MSIVEGQSIEEVSRYINNPSIAQNILRIYVSERDRRDKHLKSA